MKPKQSLLQILASFVITFLIVSFTPVSAVQYSLSYDANGNLIRDSKNYYEYNGLNQLARVREGGPDGEILAEFFYDHEGNRIKKIEYVNGEEIKTYYANPNFVRVVNSTGQKDIIYVYHNGLLVAKEEGGEKYFYHSNHLGSTDIVTDENGDLVEKTEYLPFGEVINGGNESRFLFTGKELDKAISLMYYGARYYSPLLRKFTQPDTIIQDIYDPQSLNRYAYARNNPVKYVDPSGHFLLSVNPFTIILGESTVSYNPPVYDYFRFPTYYENIFRPEVGIDYPVINPPAPFMYPDPFNYPNAFENEYKNPLELRHIPKNRREAIEDWYKMDRENFWRKYYPRIGAEIDPQSKKQDKIPIDKKGRFIDKSGKPVEFNPKEGRFHKYWDKEPKYGRYDNIDPDGKITHKGRSFRKIVSIFDKIFRTPLYNDDEAVISV